MGFPPVINVDRGPSALSQAFSAGSKGLDALVTEHRENQSRKQQLKGLAPLFEELGVDADKAGQLVESGLDPALAVQALGHVQKFNKGKGEEGQLKQIGQQSFDTMAGILKKGNLGRGSKIKGFFGGDTAQDVGQFESAAGGLESMLVDMVSRGTLSNARFKYITETLLPKANDTEEAIKGKLMALAPMLGLDANELIGGETPQKARSDRFRPKHAAMKASKGTVRMRDPETGEIHPVPADKVDHFKSQGAQVVR